VRARALHGIIGVPDDVGKLCETGFVPSFPGQVSQANHLLSPCCVWATSFDIGTYCHQLPMLHIRGRLNMLVAMGRQLLLLVRRVTCCKGLSKGVCARASALTPAPCLANMPPRSPLHSALLIHSICV
jgi:hypothetical protein